MRKVAAHHVETDNGTLDQAVCEIRRDQVVAVRRLKGEEARVEWVDGSIVCHTESTGETRAYYKQELLKE